MNEHDFASRLLDILFNDREYAAVFDFELQDVRTYADLGMLTNNAGLVVEMDDGSEFQITVVRSRGPRS